METSAEFQAFCRRYFQAVQAPILVDQPDFLQVELPREIDKELTDRPYYWMYIEATGQDVPSSVLSLSFSPDLEMEGVERLEFVTLGSFRLNKLIESTQKRGRITRAYQASPLRPGSVLHPYLLTTFKISFVADRRRDEMVSYAVHLGTGQVQTDFYEAVESLPFSSELPQGLQLAPLAIPFPTGYAAIRKQVQANIEARDHTWAQDADLHLAQELEQLETYYDSLGLVNGDEVKSDEDKQKKAAMYAAEKALRVEELKWRCAPRIQIVPFHFALLYCAEGVGSKMPFTGNRLSM